MTRIVVVHGIGQQNEGTRTLHSRLFPALQQGMELVGSTVAPEDVAFTGYGSFFRPRAEYLAPEPHYEAADVGNEFEKALLAALWRRAAEVDTRVVPPDEEVLARSAPWVQRALLAMNRSTFLSGIAERAFIGDLKQVSSYFSDASVREHVRAVVRGSISEETRVVIGHSLGSVVAYEVMCSLPTVTIEGLITLGSPLGLRHLVFDRLQPPPAEHGGILEGAWPGRVRHWTNIADAGDVVAVVEDLRPLFGNGVRQIRVHNGANPHDMSPYLTDPATGRAIVEALR